MGIGSEFISDCKFGAFYHYNLQVYERESDMLMAFQVVVDEELDRRVIDSYGLIKILMEG